MPMKGSKSFKKLKTSMCFTFVVKKLSILNKKRLKNQKNSPHFGFKNDKLLVTISWRPKQHLQIPSFIQNPKNLHLLS